MGFWTKIFGGAEGCREAMRESYQKHAAIARERNDPPHSIGLYGALGTRYLSAGIKKNEAQLWSELVPFLFMDENEASEALAEYAVFKEHPEEARVDWLRNLINRALRSCHEEGYIMDTVTAYVETVSWCHLLDGDINKILEDALIKYTLSLSETT